MRNIESLSQTNRVSIFNDCMSLTDCCRLEQVRIPQTRFEVNTNPHSTVDSTIRIEWRERAIKEQMRPFRTSFFDIEPPATQQHNQVKQALSEHKFKKKQKLTSEKHERESAAFAQVMAHKQDNTNPLPVVSQDTPHGKLLYYWLNSKFS